MPEELNPNHVILPLLTNLESQGSLFIKISSIIILVLVFQFITRKVLIRLRERYREQNRVWKSTFISALRKPLSYYVCFLATILIADLLGCNFLGYKIAHLDIIVSVASVLTFGWFLWRWNKFLVQDLSLDRNGMSASKLDIMSKLATLVILFMTLILLLDALGYSAQTLLTFGGIGGVAIAFDSQQFISNFFGGLTIYMTKPFTIGENVQIPERKIEGQVEEIGWYMTCIRDLEKRPTYVPNSAFNQSIVINTSRTTFKRIYLKIGLHYLDIPVVNQVVERIRSMLKEHPAIHQGMAIKVFFLNFGSTSLEIEISAYVKQEFVLEETRQDILTKIAAIVSESGASLNSN